MGSTKNVTVSGVDDVKIIEAPAQEAIKEAKKTSAKRVRSKKYVSTKSKIDRTKSYDLKSALEHIKALSYTKFDGTVEAHMQVKEAGVSAKVAFPHSTGKSVNVAIFSEAVLKKIEEGVIDFDVLVATPADMGKLTKHARSLGPKGLMPNPKTGTLTTNPEGKKKELEAGSKDVKSEKKAPLIHLGVGKVSMSVDELAANVEALLNAFSGKVVKLSLSATMSPSVRVTLEK